MDAADEDEASDARARGTEPSVSWRRRTWAVERGTCVALEWSARGVRATRATLVGGAKRRARRGKKMQVLGSQMDAAGPATKAVEWHVDKDLPCDVYQLVLSNEDDKKCVDEANVCVVDPLRRRRINAYEMKFAWASDLFDGSWDAEIKVHKKKRELCYELVQRHRCTEQEARSGEATFVLDPNGAYGVRMVVRQNEAPWIVWKSAPVQFKMGHVVLHARGSGYYCTSPTRALRLGDLSGYVRKGPCAGFHNCGQFEVCDDASMQRTDYARESGLNVLVLDCFTLKVVYDRTFDTFHARGSLPLGAELFLSAVSEQGELGPHSFLLRDPNRQFLFVVTTHRAFELDHQGYGAALADFLMRLGLEKKRWSTVYRYATLLDTPFRGGYPMAFVGVPGRVGWHALSVKQKEPADVQLALSHHEGRWRPLLVHARGHRWEPWMPVAQLRRAHTAFHEAARLVQVSERGKRDERAPSVHVVGGRVLHVPEPRACDHDATRASEQDDDVAMATVPVLLDERVAAARPAKDTLMEYARMFRGMVEFVLDDAKKDVHVDLVSFTHVVLDWSMSFRRTADACETWMQTYVDHVEDDVASLVFPHTSSDVASQLVVAGAVEYFAHLLQLHVERDDDAHRRRYACAWTVLCGLVASEEGFLVAEMVRRNATDAMMRGFLHAVARGEATCDAVATYVEQVRQRRVDETQDAPVGDATRMRDAWTEAMCRLADHDYRRARMTLTMPATDAHVDEHDTLHLHVLATGLAPTRARRGASGRMCWCECTYDERKKELRTSSSTTWFDDVDVFASVVFLEGTDLRTFVAMALRAPRLVRVAESRGADAVVFVWPRRYVQHLRPNPNYDTVLSIPSYSVPRNQALKRMAQVSEPCQVHVQLHPHETTASAAVRATCGPYLEQRGRSTLPSAKILSRLGRQGPCGTAGDTPVRVLSLDGGGIRGLVSVQVLQKLSRACGRPLWDLFDVVVGNSAGGLLALAVCAGVEAKQLDAHFREACAQVFGKDAWNAFRMWHGPGRSASKRFETAVRRLLGGDKADQTLLDGAMHVGCPHVCVTTCLVSRHPACVVAMRNAKTSEQECPERQRSLDRRSFVYEDRDVSLLQAMRATSAAPWYMEESTVRRDVCGGTAHDDQDDEDEAADDGSSREEPSSKPGPNGTADHPSNPSTKKSMDAAVVRARTKLRYVDGAFSVNNPTSVAVQEARHIYGKERPLVVVSVGTGVGLPEPAPSTSAPTWLQNAMAASFDVDVVDATVREMLAPQDRYYRFHPVGEAFGCALDEIREEVLEALVRDTAAYMASRGEDLAELTELLRPWQVKEKCWCIGTDQENACCRIDSPAQLTTQGDGGHPSPNR